MATTSGNLTAGKTTIGGPRQHGTGGRFGLRARVATGVATLGCAAALVVGIGGLGLGDSPPAQSQLGPAAPVFQTRAMSSYEQRRLLEQNELPEGSAMIAATIYEQRRLIEQNELSTGAGVAGASGAGYTTGNALPIVESAEFDGNGYTER